MIRGKERKAVPYVLEEDRGSNPKEQTVFWIMPKRAHETNQTVRRYGSASREGRAGYRDFNVKKLDGADAEEFAAVVSKVESYGFAKDNPFYSEFDKGVIDSTEDPRVLSAIAMDLPSAYLTEIFDVAADPSKLEVGRHQEEKKAK